MNAPKNRSPISQFRMPQEVRTPTSDYLRLMSPCGTRAWSSFRKALTRCRVPLLSLLSLSLVGCKPADKAAPQAEAKVDGNTVTFSAHSPQLTSLSVEPAAAL